MKIRIFEAFAGYGSQSLALKRLAKAHDDFSFEIVGFSEIDINAIKAYHLLHGDDVKNYGDICKVDWSKVPDFDFFTYSFPCQDISNAGKRRGFEKGSGTRSSSLWECERAIEAKKPSYLMMENVKQIIGKDNLPSFIKWLDILNELGYVSFYKILDSQFYANIPQHRERCFVFSIRKDIIDRYPHRQYCFPEEIELTKTIEDVLEDEACVNEKYYMSDRAKEHFRKHCTLTDEQIAEAL